MSNTKQDRRAQESKACAVEAEALVSRRPGKGCLRGEWGQIFQSSDRRAHAGPERHSR